MEFSEAESTKYTNGRPCAQCISGMTNLHALTSLYLAPVPPKPGPEAVEPQRAPLAPQARVVRALGRAIDRRRCPIARRVICGILLGFLITPFDPQHFPGHGAEALSSTQCRVHPLSWTGKSTRRL